jgi:hypothetical protein
MPKVKEPLRRKELEEYEPGATRSQVFSALKKVALTTKQPSGKHGQQPS